MEMTRRASSTQRFSETRMKVNQGALTDAERLIPLLVHGG